MSNLIWRPLITLKVPDPQNVAWTLALDFIEKDKIYKISVADNAGKWKLEGESAECTADGIANKTERAANSPLFLPNAPFGALIGKIGGGTADKGVPTDVGSGSATSVKTFAIGRHYVIKITVDTEYGPLFLGVNDNFDYMSKVTGQIDVQIEIAV